MSEPKHPGIILKDLYEANSYTKYQVARELDILPHEVDLLFDGNIDIDPCLSRDLSMAFPSTSPQFWRNLQKRYDVYTKGDRP